MNVQDSVFVKSCEKLSQTPASERLEIAFIGRSNVGKSSLINLLLRANLAKSSSTPGKTRLINFYTTVLSKNDLKIPLNLVDLPGFGYAKVSKTEQNNWRKSLLLFCQKRLNIKLFCMLIDSRHTNLEQDTEVFNFFQKLLRADQKILKIYTKIDKLKKQDLLALKRNELTSSNFRGFSEASFNEVWTRIFEEICKN